MKEQGCECIGATMKLFHNEDIGVSRTKTCCSLEDVEDARLVALRLGIPYYVFNFSDDFKGQVIDRFISSYERGATPNPCIDCNRYLKFERLYERARILGCDAIVTGHYVRIEQENGRWLLKNRSMRARTRATCSTRSRRISWRTRACRSARCTRARRAASRRNRASTTPTSRTVRTSASCRTATTLALSRATRAATAPRRLCR